MPKDRASQIVIGLLLLCIAALLYAYYFHGEVVSKEVNRGYSKQAKRNPYLAAQLYLSENNVQAEFSLRSNLLNDLALGEDAPAATVGANDTLILENMRGTISGQRYDQLMQWVTEGGTLVLSMENRFLGSRANDDLSQWLDVDVTTIDYSKFDEPDDIDKEDIEELENEKPLNKSPAVVEDANKTETDVAYSDASSCYKKNGYALITPYTREAINIFYYGSPTFIALGEREADWVSTETHGNHPPYVSSAGFMIGDGKIYLVRNTHLWRNPWVQCHDNAHFLWALVNPKGKVWILENRDAPSLFILLWRYLRVGLLLSALCVVVLLWRAFVRFGPVFTRQESTHRRFAEHIKADALFVWKRRDLASLLAASRAAVESRLQRKFHTYSSKSNNEKITCIQQFVAVDTQALGLALFAQDIKNHAEFIESIRILKNLKEHL